MGQHGFTALFPVENAGVFYAIRYNISRADYVQRVTSGITASVQPSAFLGTKISVCKGASVLSRAVSAVSKPYFAPIIFT